MIYNKDKRLIFVVVVAILIFYVSMMGEFYFKVVKKPSSEPPSLLPTLPPPSLLPTTLPPPFLRPKLNPVYGCVEVLAPSLFSDPKLGEYSAQYARLNWMIMALFSISQKKISYDFPGANFQFENREIVFWTDVFKPMGTCAPTKTVNLMETSNEINLNNAANFERVVDYLRKNILYQPDFNRELVARKMEWKNNFNISNDKEYVSFHMRRTDKVGTESVYCSAIQYLSYMLSANKEWPRIIFIMTDDPRAVEEVKAFVPDNGLVAVYSTAKYSRAVRSIFITICTLLYQICLKTILLFPEQKRSFS